jgi:hypothetical protein
MPLGTITYDNQRYFLAVVPVSGPAPVIQINIFVEEGSGISESQYDSVMQDLVDHFDASTDYSINVATKTRDAEQEVSPSP